MFCLCSGNYAVSKDCAHSAFLFAFIAETLGKVKKWEQSGGVFTTVYMTIEDKCWTVESPSLTFHSNFSAKADSSILTTTIKFCTYFFTRSFL